jgi:hypothetical protein
MKALRVRLMRAADIDERVALYFDERVQSNITHAGALLTAEQVRAAHERWLETGWDDRLMYRVGDDAGDLVGFTWLTGLDWLAQTAELSIMLVPRHRQRLGLLALISMYDHLYDTLNLRVVLNQVLSANQMLLSAQNRRSRAQVVSPDHVYTVGELRTAYLWGQTRADHEDYAARAAQRNTRVREALAERG